MQKISYEADQILVNQMRLKMCFSKPVLLQMLLHRKIIAPFITKLWAPEFRGTARNFAAGNTEVILCACSLGKGIALECGRVESKNSKLPCLQENRAVHMPQW